MPRLTFGKHLLRFISQSITGFQWKVLKVEVYHLSQSEEIARLPIPKHLTTSLALEWARRGVRVNSISPGYINTPMTSGPEWDEKRARFSEDTPLGRMGTPEELVGPAVFLASDASRYCTGADLLVDGGFTGW